MTGITAKFLGRDEREGRRRGGGGVRNGGRDRGRDELERAGQSGERVRKMEMEEGRWREMKERWAVGERRR